MPKNKKLFNVVDIVTLTGVKKKKYACDYRISYEYKLECTSQYRRIFTNSMMKISKKFSDFTILMKDKTYISKEDILQNPVLQFY